MNLLKVITELSRVFGTADYVQGGGGNSSAKDSDTLWIKPSGTTMGNVAPDTFVPLDRGKLAKLYEVTPPEDAAAREALVKDMMLASVKPGSSGRPSVEAPLHNAFSAVFVVHTHPALVNGMTCSQEGRKICGQLFPDALWIDYIDPGYTLSVGVRKHIQACAADRGREPHIVFIQNHGVFVAADSPETITAITTDMMDRLRKSYQEAGVPTELLVGPPPPSEEFQQVADVLAALPEMAELTCARADGQFPVAGGPLTPDHIVYMKAYPMIGEPTAENISNFVRGYGYAPRVMACRAGVFGMGATDKNAALALEMARDGAFVEQLAEAFGGVRFMTRKAMDFIDNWEVEAYRRKVAS